MNRVCGPCTMCCTTMAVEDMTPPKPNNCRCEHQRKIGCAIYKDRPQTCADFQCLWLMDGGRSVPGDLRPDKVKAIMVPTETGGVFVYVRPEHQGAHLREPLRSWLANVGERLSVVVICGTERIIIGSKGAEQIRRHLTPARLVQLRSRAK